MSHSSDSLTKSMYTIPVTSLQKPMAPSSLGGILPPAHNESYAARCCIFGNRLTDDKLTTAHSQPEFPPASSSVNLLYSTGNPTSPVSTSATDTPTPTVEVTRLYSRKSVSYLRYLKREIKQLNSQVNSCSRNLHRQIRQLHFKIDLNASELRTIILLIAKEYNKVSDVETVLPIFDKTNKLYSRDLKIRMDQLKTIRNKYAFDIGMQSQTIKWKSALFAEALHMHVNLLNSKIDSYTGDIEEVMNQLNSHYSSSDASVKKELAKFYF